MIDVVAEDNRLTIRAEICAPRERVWQALTEKERIAEWWGYVSLDARPGGCLTERWADASGKEVVTYGEVLRVDAPRTLELTWADDDWDEPTRVIFRLEEAPEGTTRLTLEHSGWETFPPSSCGTLVQAHASGWSHHVANLASYAARTPR